ncbi:Glutathione synthetase [Aphelenchoides bicaudatus]|nr:Glutathione synthetase [Aphelenchoides bicaudatus]
MDYVEKLIDPKKLPNLVEDALDYAHCIGLVIRTPDHKDRSDICQNAPFALLPSPFPRHLFEQGMNVQKALNLLYFKISWDQEFLINTHKDVIPEDKFTRDMVNCYLAVRNSGGPKQTVMLLTQRGDYMCHTGDSEQNKELSLKQIEVNNIAVSMGGLAQKGYFTASSDASKTGDEQKFNNPKAAVLVVIENVNQNQPDQRYVEYELERLEYGIKIIRVTLTEAHEKLKLNANHELEHKDYPHPIALVYFRAGYSPDHYPTEIEWEARLRIEQSTAIKCPWIGLQLANTKKVQQVLASHKTVERFLTDPKDIQAVYATFAGLWGLENEDKETEDIVKDAIEHPERYVLKPQLEGGAGNYYGDEIPKRLKSYSLRERATHILMQRIRPLVVKNYHVRAFHGPELANTVSELGTYGYLLGDGKNLEVYENQSSGHILRSKAEHVNEGGVAVGYAVIDGPFLF